MSSVKSFLKLIALVLTFEEVVTAYLVTKEYNNKIEIRRSPEYKDLEELTKKEIEIIGAAPPTGSRISAEWKIVDPPLAYASHVQLECNIHCWPPVIRSDQNIRWIVNNTKTIGQSNFSTVTSKYRIWEGVFSSRLEIRNFSPKDANINYMCSYGFQSYSRNLTLNENNFERQPTKEDIFSGLETHGTLSQITVNITKVFPRPNCSALLNLKNLTSEIWYTFRQNDSLYDATINVQCNESGYFALKCQIGRMTHIVYEKNIPEINKDDKDIQTATSFSCECWIFGGIGVSLLVVILAAFVLYQCRKNKNRINTGKSSKDKAGNQPEKIFLKESMEKQKRKITGINP